MSKKKTKYKRRLDQWFNDRVDQALNIEVNVLIMVSNFNRMVLDGLVVPEA